MEQTPKVSIGLTVFNGEQYLAEAIDSILTQTFTDFELIISDNASTDRTPAICQDYASRDSRIRYHRNATNIGGGNNENVVFRLSRGQYFRWAAHDDVCAPQLLEKCVAVLDHDPWVVLCYSTVTEINEHGQVLEVTHDRRGEALQPHERLRELAGWGHDCEASYGLMRSAVLRQTPLQMNYTDCDRTLLAEVSLYGRFCQLPEPLFFKRIHPNMSILAFPGWYGRMAWFGPQFGGRHTFPCWQQFFHYLRAIAKSPVSAAEKLRCYRYMLRWLSLEHHGRMMLFDMANGGMKLFGLPTFEI